MQFSYFAPCAKGLEYLLVDELRALGADDARETVAGVSFTGGLELAYKALIWSRLASRVLLHLKRFEIDNADDVYEAARVLPWYQHLSENDRIAIDFNGTNNAIRHTQFGAQRVKDAICDAFKESTGKRPDVDRENPTIRINAYLEKRHLSLSIDLSGHALHERGYRARAGIAPLKETLASAMLMRARWPQIARDGGALIDPMCGSGTLVIEAALMALDVAPGLLREDFGCNRGWRLHDESLWQSLRSEAQQRADAAKSAALAAGWDVNARFYGFDRDGHVLHVAESNANVAGVLPFCHFRARALTLLQKPESAQAGLVISNPPYGERLGDKETLQALYQEWGDKLLEQFNGFSAALITSELDLAKSVGIRSHKQYKLFNGALECQLYLFSVAPDQRWVAPERRPYQVSEQALALRNRIEKNRKGLGNWLKRESVSCYRVYDADIPEYASAIDVYGEHLFIQEYAAPKTIEPDIAQKRFRDTVEIAKQVFECKDEQVFVRQRQRQRGNAQYEKQGEQGEFFIAHEGGLQFWVNLSDYLDTGLFLDHRRTRTLVREKARGKHFLNLFSYTGSVSVYAAAGGAASTTSVDLSPTYGEWALRNMELNGFRQRSHQFVQSDVMPFLSDCRHGYDLIFVDPPTFSNSKRTTHDFDVQRDHVALLTRCLDLLKPGGELIFSNNYRRFQLSAASFPQCRIEDISRQTIPPDFVRNEKIHQCWIFRPVAE